MAVLLDSLIFQTEARVRWLDAWRKRGHQRRRGSRRAPLPARRREGVADECDLEMREVSRIHVKARGGSSALQCLPSR